jgi:hypothetical protein
MDIRKIPNLVIVLVGDFVFLFGLFIERWYNIDIGGGLK